MVTTFFGLAADPSAGTREEEEEEEEGDKRPWSYQAFLKRHIVVVAGEGVDGEPILRGEGRQPPLDFAGSSTSHNRCMRYGSCGRDCGLRLTIDPEGGTEAANDGFVDNEVRVGGSAHPMLCHQELHPAPDMELVLE